jgi:Nickel responsive protein SCO4226-like
VADETDRCLFLVEHDLRGLLPWQLAAVHRALGEAVRRENQRGRQIRYVQRIYAPEEQRCLCLFEAASPDLVRSVNDIAQFPLARVMAVLSSVPDATGATAGLDDTGLTSSTHRAAAPRLTPGSGLPDGS